MEGAGLVGVGGRGRDRREPKRKKEAHFYLKKRKKEPPIRSHTFIVFIIIIVVLFHAFINDFFIPLATRTEETREQTKNRKKKF